MKLTDLHEEFIATANRQMTLGRLPITAKKTDAPVIATNRWHLVDGSVLVKKYSFRTFKAKREFIVSLMDYEEQVQHHAHITIDESDVVVKLTTKDLDKATELDKEMARFCDVLYRDLSYGVDSGDGREPDEGVALKIADE